MRRRAGGLTAVLAALVLLGSACPAGSPDVPASSLGGPAGGPRPCPVEGPTLPAPIGGLEVGYPDEPTVWLPALGDDTAAADLAALWGLPLYDHDAAGQLRPRLVSEAVVLGAGNGGWQVRLLLCPGSWSDGAPVEADDVVATIEALRDGPAPPALGALQEARTDGPDVVLTFDGPTGRWQHLLADVGTILPAHVLAEGGLEAYRDDVPVSGGPFRLVAQEPGRSRTFTANTASALGSPRTLDLEVLVVPRFELALGLLDAGELDIALGHLAFETHERAEDLEGIEAQAAVGGTLLTWRWLDTPTVATTDDRLRVQASFDLEPFVEGLLDGQGELARSFVFQDAGPPARDRRSLTSIPELVVSSPRWHEAPGLVSRAVRDGIERLGGTVRTTADDAAVLVAEPLGDATIAIRRFGPWPSLEALAGGREDARLLTADRAPAATDPAVHEGLVALDELAVEVPLVRMGVAHAWVEGVAGLAPSGWPGIGFHSAQDWVLAG